MEWYVVIVLVIFAGTMAAIIRAAVKNETKPQLPPSTELESYTPQHILDLMDEVNREYEITRPYYFQPLGPGQTKKEREFWAQIEQFNIALGNELRGEKEK